MVTPARAVLTEEFGQLLHMTAHDWRTALDRRLRPLGLTRATWLLLVHVAKLSGPSQTVLADHMGLEDASIVRLVDRLEGDGLVERRSGPDRRMKTIHFTAKGEALSAEIFRVAASLRREVFADIADADVAAARALLVRLHARLEALA